MRAARVLVTLDLLREALRLPIETDIRFVKTVSHNEIELIVHHPDLKDVDIKYGEDPPIASPVFKRQEPVVFVDWGQK